MALPSTPDFDALPPDYHSLFMATQPEPTFLQRLLQDRELQRKIAFGVFISCLILLFLCTLTVMVVVIIHSGKVREDVSTLQKEFKSAHG